MTKLATIARTAIALGPLNLARVAAYRLGVTAGLNPVRKLRGSLPRGDFFSAVMPESDLAPVPDWKTQARFFGNRLVQLSDGPPDWHKNYLNGARISEPQRGWWLIPDFDLAVGDIKTVWEASRFDWVLAFAEQHRSGEIDALARLNRWLSDWWAANPPFCGPNWKCGQEASIRVMHLAMAAVILGQERDSCRGLLDSIALHLKRIEPTISYAVAQDNNHGTSEAAALYIGGSWLAAHDHHKDARRWQKLGTKWLENRVSRLVSSDGSFAQHSVNYHRLVVDTLSMVEVWRRAHELSPFSLGFRQRAIAASEWLYHVTSPESGGAPNLGANDGARLLHITAADYRDFRPSVQLAFALHKGARAWSTGDWDAPLRWLRVPIPENISRPAETRVFDDGGYAVLRNREAMAVLRYPRFRFRPSHADALHVDLWRNGVNLLRDAGTYSYNTDSKWLEYFPGTISHNTVQFDHRDQMPRLGRFLFGDWLKTERIEARCDDVHCLRFTASYKDSFGARHCRRLALSRKRMLVEDNVSGFKRSAVLRWRLAPGKWNLQNGVACNGRDRLSVSSDAPIVRMELAEGWESVYYQTKTVIPVLEVEIGVSGILKSEYVWSA